MAIRQKSTEKLLYGGESSLGNKTAFLLLALVTFAILVTVFASVAQFG